MRKKFDGVIIAIAVVISILVIVIVPRSHNQPMEKKADYHGLSSSVCNFSHAFEMGDIQVEVYSISVSGYAKDIFASFDIPLDSLYFKEDQIMDNKDRILDECGGEFMVLCQIHGYYWVYWVKSGSGIDYEEKKFNLKEMPEWIDVHSSSLKLIIPKQNR